MINKKDFKFQLRVTAEEIKMLRTQAKALGLSVSAYLRMLVYKDKG